MTQSSANSPADQPRLVRQLNLFDSTMIGMGIVIGSGIFMTTGIIAQSIPSTILILLAWTVGGALTLTGALTYAELSASMPEAGGQYVYLREAYGEIWAFLFGWVLMLVYWTGGIAALAAAFAEFFGYFVPGLSSNVIVFSSRMDIFGFVYGYTLSMGQIVAASIILLVSAANYFGVVIGKSIQNVITVIKILVIAGIIVWGFTALDLSRFEWSFIPAEISFSKLLIGFGLSLVAITWAFDGWNNITVVAGEVKNAERNMLRSLVTITLAVTAMYVLINIIYLGALPMKEVVGEVRIAEKATSALFGGSTAAFISAVILVSTLGSINGSILVGPRVFYAMAKDGLFFKSLAGINRRFKTPGNAIIVQALWCIILALSGTFEQLITFAMFSAIAFGIAAAFSVFTLRRKRPEMKRPYKTWGYPVTPIIFIIASFGILIAALIEKPLESVAGILLTVAGIPVYYIWNRKKDNAHCS